MAVLLVLCFAGTSFAQQNQPNQPFPVERPPTRADDDKQPGSFGEMVLRQQISKRRKEHDDLLKRGEEALKLSEELEKSIGEKETVDAPDLAKLQALEKIVSKIRSDLGGDDDDNLLEDSSGKENFARQSVSTAFKFLRESTKSLFEELKRSSRFSISAAAIQTSNAVIRFARFLRIKK